MKTNNYDLEALVNSFEFASSDLREWYVCILPCHFRCIIDSIFKIKPCV